MQTVIDFAPYPFLKKAGDRPVKPIVAIVGRPNVGKSTLFNRLIQKRIAIIEDVPGITRDRIYADAEWNGREFTLVDTGGVLVADVGSLENEVTRQAQLAMKEADLVVFLVNGRDGVTGPDQDVASILRRVKKPVLLAVNKVEHLKHEDQKYEFYQLGLGDPVGLSALHGMGTGDLLDAIVEHLPHAPEVGEETDDDVVKVAVIGRPNVGKSSLVNALFGAERVIVADFPGTTRDAVDVLVEQEGYRFLLIDTAGMRKRGKIDYGVEKFSVMRSLRAVERADVVLVVIDAADGVTEQDQRIAGYADEHGKACVVVVNKWDLVEKDEKTMQEFTLRVRERLAFMPYAEITFVSAKTHSRLHKLLPVVASAAASRAKRVNTGPLNDVIRDAVALNPPPTDKGKQLKIYYVTQAQAKPPVFLFFVNDPQLIHFSYRRYLENKLREAFGFEGSPILLIMKNRDQNPDRDAAQPKRGRTAYRQIREDKRGPRR